MRLPGYLTDLKSGIGTGKLKNNVPGRLEL